ncbi:MAG TPA: hypothetical protein PLL66_01675 [Bacteroidales bacterium]|nr:hypothetical protein [Bacteroidales bacterium]
MSSNKNIEDFFRSEFDNFEVNPSGKVWSGINKRLTIPRFNAMYKNAFNGFKISPSEHIWRRVAAVIWLNKFIHFTPFSFNIYYLGIIVTAIVGTVITVDNSPNLKFIHFDNKTITIENETENNNIFDVPDYAKLTEIASVHNNLKSDIILDAKLGNSNYNTDEFIVENNLFAPDNTNNATEKSESFNVMQDPVQDNSKDLVISTNNDETDEILDNNIQDDILSVESEPDNVTNIFAINNEDIVLKKDILPSRLKMNSISLLTYQPGWSEFADNKLSGIPYLDPIVYDTVGYNHAGDPIVMEKSWFTIDLFYSPVVYNHTNKLLNSELQQNYNFYSSNNKALFSHYAGIGLSFNYKNIKIESGFSYLQLNESLNQSTKFYDSITYHRYDYFENHRWEYDTTMILDLDEYLTGNIVYIEHVDSCLFNYQDSVLSEYRDTALVEKTMLAENQYHIFDIPLIAGYELNYGKMSITPKAGLITSYLIKRTGTTYNIIKGDIGPAKDLPSSKLLFDYYAGINIQYRISKNIAVFVEPHIRSDINSLYKSSYAISEKSMKYGVKTGLSIIF